MWGGAGLRHKLYAIAFHARAYQRLMHYFAANKYNNRPHS